MNSVFGSRRMFAIVAMFLFLVPAAAMAQWLPAQRLTNAADTSFVSDVTWCVAANGDTVHVVWFDKRFGNFEILHKRSVDGGATWSADTRLTHNAYASSTPSIALSGSAVHVVWKDERDGNLEIYYKGSSDGGVTWGADTRLTNDFAKSWWPCVAASGPFVYAVWKDFRDGNEEIYFKRSTDCGATWKFDKRLSVDVAVSQCPSIAASGTFVTVVWHDTRDGHAEIYSIRSTDRGAHWDDETRLTAAAGFSYGPSIAQSGALVHVAWLDNRDASWEVYYTRSTDSGVSWEADQRITRVAPSNASYPSIAAAGPVAHLLWIDDREGWPELYSRRSIDGGAAWGDESRVTDIPAPKFYATVAVSGPAVHAVWSDARDGNWEVYYAQNPNGNVTGAGDAAPGTPEGFAITRVFPHPFGASAASGSSLAVAEYRLPRAAHVVLALYDLLGRRVAVLADGRRDAGLHRADIRSERLPTGVYFCRLDAEHASSGRMIIVRK